jgi:hypothetical protein
LTALAKPFIEEVVKEQPMSSQSDKPLKIGYIWQYQGVGMDSVSASVLHIKAVRQGF